MLPDAAAAKYWRNRSIAGPGTNPAAAILVVEVADSRDARDVAEYALTIQPEQSLAIATDRLPTARPGETYLCQLQAAGGLPPYSWTWSASGPPTPLSNPLAK